MSFEKNLEFFIELNNKKESGKEIKREKKLKEDFSDQNYLFLYLQECIKSNDPLEFKNKYKLIEQKKFSVSKFKTLFNLIVENYNSEILDEIFKIFNENDGNTYLKKIYLEEMFNVENLFNIASKNHNCFEYFIKKIQEDELNNENVIKKNNIFVFHETLCSMLLVKIVLNNLDESNINLTKSKEILLSNNNLLDDYSYFFDRLYKYKDNLKEFEMLNKNKNYFSINDLNKKDVVKMSNFLINNKFALNVVLNNHNKLKSLFSDKVDEIVEFEDGFFINKLTGEKQLTKEMFYGRLAPNSIHFGDKNSNIEMYYSYNNDHVTKIEMFLIEKLNNDNIKKVINNPFILNHIINSDEILKNIDLNIMDNTGISLINYMIVNYSNNNANKVFLIKLLEEMDEIKLDKCGNSPIDLISKLYEKNEIEVEKLNKLQKNLLLNISDSERINNNLETITSKKRKI